MKNMRRARWLAASVTITLVVAGSAVGLIAAGVGDRHGSSANPGPEAERSGRFGAPNRDRLAICVDAEGVLPVFATQARNAFESALQSLSDDPVWVRVGLSEPSPIVQEDCPAGPALYDPDAGPKIDDSLFEVRGRAVANASYYSIHVYVIPQADIDHYTGRDGYRLTGEEYFCSQGSCSEITAGLYVSPDELVDQARLSDLLAHAIGLRR